MYKVRVMQSELPKGNSVPPGPPYLFGLSTPCFAAGVKGRIICTECRGGRSLFRERCEEPAVCAGPEQRAEKYLGGPRGSLLPLGKLWVRNLSF